MNRDSLDDAELLQWFESVVSESVGRYPGDPKTVKYGSHPLQLMDLWGDLSSMLWVVSIHGGYFAAEYDRTVNEPLSRRLASEGMAVANIEYRRAGSVADPRETVNDVRAAIAEVILLAPVESRVVVIGHSAGGYLAITGATHDGVHGVLPLAPVTDLAGIAIDGWDEGEIAKWIGKPLGDTSGVWEELQPDQIGSTHAPIVVIHGSDDRVVPVEHTHEFLERHKGVRLVELAEVGHYEFLDPESDSFATLIFEIQQSFR
jgi:acetyl esterase/lipase